MTSPDEPRPDLPEPPGATPLDDGPVIDPRDPLGLGDLPLDDVPLGELPPDLLGPPRRPATVGTQDVPAGAREDLPQDVVADAGGEPFADVDPDGAPAATSEPAATADAEPRAQDAQDTAPEAGSVPESLVDDVDAHDGTATDDGTVTDDGTATDDDTVTGDDTAAPGSATPAPVDVAPAPAPATGVPPVRPARAGWSRLAHAMRPRTTQGQLITAGLCALLGFALVVQVRQASDTQLGSLRQNDLVRLLDETTTRTEELEREAFDLQRERDELVSGSDRQQAALDAARRTAAMQGILTGRLPATGPGVRITLTEPDGDLRPVTMLHVLEELRNAGAEAMELNGHRITASSAFTGTRGAVELDGVTITSPYRWTVIGNPDTIAPALEIPGGAMAQVRGDGGRGTVEKTDRAEVTAVRVLPDPVHASPAPDAP